MSGYLSEIANASGIRARVVAHSVAKNVDRAQYPQLFSVETRAPKFIDAEFEKHRMLSSNSSSSRAIPFKRLNELFLPPDVRAKSSGMQGNDVVTDELVERFHLSLKNIYSFVYDVLAEWSDTVHKQHLNRYQEAFAFQTKVVTSTQWWNFFSLRLAVGAQPEIQILARCMQAAMMYQFSTEYFTDSRPSVLEAGEWHTPYLLPTDHAELTLEQRLNISAGRCARVSFVSHERKATTPEEDIKLSTRLLMDGHMTPFEHQATPMDPAAWKVHEDPTTNWPNGVTHVDRRRRPWSANFLGWAQYRTMLQDVNPPEPSFFRL